MEKELTAIDTSETEQSSALRQNKNEASRRTAQQGRLSGNRDRDKARRAECHIERNAARKKDRLK